MDDPLEMITERRGNIIDKNQKNGVQSMLPPTPNSINRQSFEPRKPSTPRREVPIHISASARFRNPSNINKTLRSASRSDLRTTPSWGHHDISRASSTNVEKNSDTINDFQELHTVVVDEGNERPGRKRPLFGRRDNKAKRDSGETFVEKPKDAEPKKIRRVLVRPPKTSKGVSNYEKEWGQGVYGEVENNIVTETGSAEFHHHEEQPLENYFDGDGFDEPSNIIDQEYGDEVQSVASYEPVGGSERTIQEGSSPERKTKNDTNMIDLDESLKLIPQKRDYRPGSYSGLTHEEWLLAGQNLTERFKENSERVQKIIITRAERMKAYTDTMTEYYEILKQRQSNLKQEREGIQESVRESIASYWKSHRM